MANWQELKVKVGHATDKTIKKTEEIAEITSLYVKLSFFKAKRDDAYKRLGKLTYRQLKDGESQAETIAPVIAEIDAHCARIQKISEQIKKAQQEKKAQQAQKKAQAEASAHQSDADIENGVREIINECQE